MIHEAKEFLVDQAAGGMRLDAYLAAKLQKEYSRSRLQKMIKDGLVTVDGQTMSAHYAVHEGQKIHMTPFQVKEHELCGEEIELDIRYEDEDLIVVHKPAGFVVHPGPGNPDHTLVNALIHHCRGLQNVGDSERPGIVHRLDKETSGLIVAAKNARAHEIISRQFQNHEVKKMYWAVVAGVVQHDEFICQEPVGRSFLNKKKNKVKPSGGKSAETFFRVLERFQHATWLEVHPKTGRTHQIRVHLSHLGYPILGDKLYGHGSDLIDRHALHAASIAFEHPVSGKQISLTSTMPQDMEQLLEHLRAAS